MITNIVSSQLIFLIMLNPPDNQYTYPAVIKSVYDGDTCTAEISIGFSVQLNGIKLRLYGINAPELRNETLELGRASRDYLKELVLDKAVVLQTFKDAKGKYGRYLAKLWIVVGTEWICVNDALVSSGHAIYQEY